LWQEAGDFFSIYSLKDPGTKPQGEAAKSLETAQAMIVILPASQATTTAFIEPWLEKHPTAIILPLPKGENLFEAHKAGVDLRAWLIDALPPELKIGAQDGLALKLPPEGEAPGEDAAPKLTIPPMDIKGMVDSFIKDINGFIDAKMAPLKAMQKEVEGKALKKILAAGRDPGMFSAAAQNPPILSAGEASQAGLAKMAKERAKLQAAGLLTPELDRQFADAAGKIKEAGAQGDALMKDGQAKLAAARKTCEDVKAKAKSGELPTQVKDKLAAAGIDPEKMKRLTREEVEARHARG
ncbi:MAG: hypothetical protein HQK55_14975, partial [Deltaproteobacteria bacterium]|nr:hypothetical protein [Deltaproteobacteria bacterium]